MSDSTHATHAGARRLHRRVCRIGLAGLLAAVVMTPGLCADSPLTEEDARSVRPMLAAILNLRQRFDARNAALQARIDQLDLGHFLGPSRLVSTSELQAARASLVSYRALLVERDRLTEDFATEGHAILAALPDDGLREKALRANAEQADHRRAVRVELLKTQVDNADAMEAVIDWADRHHAIVHLRGTKLAIDGQHNLDEFNALDARLDVTARRMAEAAERAGAEQERAGNQAATLPTEVLR